MSNYFGKQPSSRPIVYQATALATSSTVTSKFSNETYQIRVAASQPVWLVTGDTSSVSVTTGAGIFINGGVAGEYLTVSPGDAIDQLRAGDQQQPQAPAEPVALDKQIAAQQETATPQAQTPPVAEDPVQKALSDPAVLNAVQQHVAQANQQAEAMGNYYAQAVQHNAMAATAALVQQYPELANLTPEQIPVAIKTIAATQPERAQSIVRHIENTSRLVAESQRVQAAQVQAYQQEAQRQWQRYANDEDAKYTEFEKTRPAAEVKAVRENVLRVLSSVYGYPEADLARAYHSNPRRAQRRCRGWLMKLRFNNSIAKVLPARLFRLPFRLFSAPAVRLNAHQLAIMSSDH
jgi:hypothetical protein